jgi:SAM-dependent methyltransferase
MMNAIHRFSNRVDNYIRYRPHYPPGILDCLREDCRLTPASVVADVGSGTGILAELFLRHGNTLYGVEPNREMQAAGERLLQAYTRFHSIAATAEETGLPAGSVDFVTAGQAFHWFDRDRARTEFQRILKPQGWVVLVWNARRASTPFGKDYEALVRTYATDYQQVNHTQIDGSVLREFFGQEFMTRTFDNGQSFDVQGLTGRLLSSSYAPEAGHPQHAAMLSTLQEIFDAHQVKGRVAFEYETEVHYGHLD